ncbi:hypothetical protein [Gulosibacter molinativorax]|uniref:ABC transporter permease n=1 Tax=Gulosibacter molinativorax TaxID=256821 RepID=A0ABT7C414_9MICO|nr:hypothetical protein [Gulosibacter molinativorax]MDJ1369898.1 hypothetical protein [Gulosibacter molinativorax]QUY61867.1 Hypotetical protein [Gulosibacter molinativorax]
MSDQHNAEQSQPQSQFQSPYVPQPSFQEQPSQLAPTAPRSGGAGLAKLALIFAIVTVVVHALLAWAPSFLLISDVGSLIVSAAGIVNALLTLVLSATALVLGIIALRRGQGLVIAGIAVGLACAELFGVLVSFAGGLIFNLAASTM